MFVHRRPKTFVLAAIVALVGIAGASPALAQWKWRDAAGHVQYSDLPPPSGVREADILQRPTAVARRGAVDAAAAASATASRAAGAASAPLLVPAARASDPELEARRKRAEQDAADRKRIDDQKQAAARAENCARAQEARRTVDSGVRMTRTNKQGEREYLDDAARAAEARRAQQVIDSDCR